MNDGIARMGELAVSSQDVRELRALGLGSCIGLCVYDSGIKMGCIAHIMLPQVRSKPTKEPAKYADTAVTHAIETMVAMGAAKHRLRAAIVGGAQLFTFAGAGEHLDVGKRNIEAVKRLLTESRLRLIAEDVGGIAGRTVTLDTSTGNVTVKQVGGIEKQLTNLA